MDFFLNLKDLCHLIIIEQYIIILRNDNSIIVHLDETSKHIEKLSLFSRANENFTISLVIGACKKVNEHQSDKKIKHYSGKSHNFYILVASPPKVRQTQ